MGSVSFSFFWHLDDSVNVSAPTAAGLWKIPLETKTILKNVFQNNSVIAQLLFLSPPSRPPKQQHVTISSDWTHMELTAGAWLEAIYRVVRGY